MSAPDREELLREADRMVEAEREKAAAKVRERLGYSPAERERQIRPSSGMCGASDGAIP